MSISTGLEAIAHNIASIGALIASIGALLNSRKASKELQPNHGSSARDALNALRGDVAGLRLDIEVERKEREIYNEIANQDRQKLWQEVKALGRNYRRRSRKR